MKKIFILRGVSNTGKTTKINQIAEWMINTYNTEGEIGLDTENLLRDTHGVLKIGLLTIGFNSSGDNIGEVLEIDKLNIVDGEYPDIILCACRTKRAGFQHIRDNYNRNNNWLQHFIRVPWFYSEELENIQNRDTDIIEELRTWLTGLEKQ